MDLIADFSRFLDCLPNPTRTRIFTLSETMDVTYLEVVCFAIDAIYFDLRGQASSTDEDKDSPTT